MTEPTIVPGPAVVSPRAPLRGATFAEAVRRFFAHALCLSGRASRSEFWWWTLVQSGVSTLLTWIKDPHPDALTVKIGPAGEWGSYEMIIYSFPPGSPLDAAGLYEMVYTWWALLTFVPTLTLAVRRLHDSNCSGYWILLHFLGPLGSFILLCMMIRAPRPEGIRFDE